MELLHGALEALILRTLSDGDDHGYGISRRIESATGGAVQVEDGSLYPALYRLERKALIKGEWGLTEARKRAACPDSCLERSRDVRPRRDTAPANWPHPRVRRQFTFPVRLATLCRRRPR